MYNLSPSFTDAPFKSIALEILVLSEYYSAVMKFIEERQQFSCGRVNQALCATLENLMQDYRVILLTRFSIFVQFAERRINSHHYMQVFIIQLEMKHRREALSLQGFLFSIQPFLETMSCLARIVHTVYKVSVIFVLQECEIRFLETKLCGLYRLMLTVDEH